LSLKNSVFITTLLVTATSNSYEKFLFPNFGGRLSITLSCLITLCFTLLTSSWFNYVQWRSFYYKIIKFTTVLKNPCSYVYISNIYVASEALKMDNEYFHTSQWTHRFVSLRRVPSLSCYFHSPFCSELACALTFLFHFLLRVFTVYSPSLVFSLVSTSQVLSSHYPYFRGTVNL